MKLFNKEMLLTAIVLVFGVFMISNTVQAQSKSQQTLKGKVTDSASNQALTGITVSISAKDLSTETDMEGYYTFDALTAGTYVVSVETDGYKKWEKEVTVEEGEKNLDIQLEPKPEGQTN